MKKVVVVALLALLGLACGVALADQGAGLEETEFLSPLPAMQYQPMAEDENMMPNGSFEEVPHDLYWQEEPGGQIAYEPDRALDGEWVLVQGRSEQARDEIVYYCWAAGALDEFVHFVLLYNWECESTDIWQQNGGRMSWIYWDGYSWKRFTNYFGVITHNYCGGSFTWHPVGWSFPGFEQYTDHAICLSIESINPSAYWTHEWYDAFQFLAREPFRVYLPLVVREY